MQDEFVVVTGAGGFIGSNIVGLLASEGMVVVASDRFRHENAWQYLSPHLIHDIVEPDSLMWWLERYADRVRAIVHMGAISATTETDVVKVVQNNIRLTLDLWGYASRTDATFIYASSAATYGDGTHGFVDDDTPEALSILRPLNLYGWSKHFVDRRLIDDVTCGRPAPTRWAGLKFFNVYGPNESHKGLMRSVVHQLYPIAAGGDTVRLFKSDHPDYPDGGQLRDFVYVKDCCAIVRALMAMPSVSGLFNAGTGQARTFEDLARAVFTALGREASIEYVPMPEALRGKYQYFTQADLSKLRDHGLAPEFHTLERGVEDYVVSHLAPEFADTGQ